MLLRIFHSLGTLFRCLFHVSPIFVFANIISVTAYAQDSWLDLVSVENGEHSRDIIFQSYDGQWKPPVWLTQGSRTDEFSPVNLRVSDQQTLVLWKELTGVDASNLLFTLIDVDTNGEVLSIGEIQTLTTDTPHQSSPTLIQDSEGLVWGFWIGFNGSDDDIYFASFSNGEWSAEKRLFEQPNGVPDVRPTARINADGAVEIRWQQYSFDEDAYIDVHSLLESDTGSNQFKWSEPRKYVINPLEKTPKLPQDFSLPSTVTMPDSVAINYADHRNIAFHWNSLPRQDDLTGDNENGAD